MRVLTNDLRARSHSGNASHGCWAVNSASAEAEWPLIYLRDSSTFTVPRGLKALLDQFGFGGEWHWEVVMTASVITTVPMIILFFLGQKHFIRGIATTGGR
jgi:ABC-type glycerol-3-phosphate transport system permease component